MVDTFSPTPFDIDQPRALELSQVTRCSRPAAREALGDLSRHHLTTAKSQHEQDVPSRRVRQGAEDGIRIG